MRQQTEDPPKWRQIQIAKHPTNRKQLQSHPSARLRQYAEQYAELAFSWRVE